MKRVMSDDVNPCLAFHPKTAALSEKLLTAIVANMLVIEMAPAPAGEDVVCALTLGKVVGERETLYGDVCVCCEVPSTKPPSRRGTHSASAATGSRWPPTTARPRHG